MPEQSNNPEHSMHLRQRAEARLDATRKDLRNMAGERYRARGAGVGGAPDPVADAE